MSWQAPQVSAKRCFIAPSGQSLAVYCACAGSACTNNASASSEQPVSGRARVVGIFIVILVFIEVFSLSAAS